MLTLLIALPIALVVIGSAIKSVNIGFKKFFVTAGVILSVNFSIYVIIHAIIITGITE